MGTALLSTDLSLHEKLKNHDASVELIYSLEEIFTRDRKIDLLYIDELMIKSFNEDLLTSIISNPAFEKKIIISTVNDIYQFQKFISLGFDNYILNDKHLVNQLNDSILKTPKSQLNSFEFNDLIKGQSEKISKVFKVMKKAAASKINVNITGETGTGKELVAKAIHEGSSRKNNKLISVNIASIPMDLIESELFGYEEGAFTGATKKRIGKFEEAKGGTLFLDEIGELPMNLQTKLLRVLQEGELSRLGGNEVVKTDIRLITATHRDLNYEVSNNNFREDLYYRILGLPIHLPPLRERKEDIPEIVSNFIEQTCLQNNIIPLKKINKEALKVLNNYSFPGNIRQLKAIIELAVVLSDNNVISERDILIEYQKSDFNILEKERTLEEYNIEIIEHFLKKYQGKVNFVADKLAMSKSKIYKWITEGKISKT